MAPTTTTATAGSAAEPGVEAPPTTTVAPGEPSAAQWEALRQCESSGNYGAVSSSGRYRGAYQFDQTTWDGVAERHFPWLMSIDPIDAAPWWQDSMARALWSERGRQPWPICGKLV